MIHTLSALHACFNSDHLDSHSLKCLMQLHQLSSSVDDHHKLQSAINVKPPCLMGCLFQNCMLTTMHSENELQKHYTQHEHVKQWASTSVYKASMMSVTQNKDKCTTLNHIYLRLVLLVQAVTAWVNCTQRSRLPNGAVAQWGLLIAVLANHFIPT
jgi:hypothetical protein